MPERLGVASGWSGVTLPLMILLRTASNSFEVAG
jgi:hypothetical protein